MEFEKLQSIIAQVLTINKDEITPETKFIDDLGTDSLDVFEIILAIEDEFEIHISDSQAEKIITVGDALEEIKKSI